MTPKRAFDLHKRSADKRGVEFAMTFDEWWSIWEPWFHLRGNSKNGLCMARERDEGPYKVGNVYITTKLGNGIDAARFRKQKVSDEERIAGQHKREILGAASKWSKSDQVSHLSFKANCNPEKFVPD